MSDWRAAEDQVEAFLLGIKADIELWAIAQDVALDYGNACDHPEDCDCSMARLARAVAEHRQERSS